MNPISALPDLSLLKPLALPELPAAGQAAETGQVSFKDFLLSSIRRVNAAQHEADQAVEKLFTGDQITPAEVLTAVQKADLAFRMMIQVRNKLVEAYTQIEAIRV